MVLNLSVSDRILILNLDTLPQVGNIVTMKIKQNILSMVGFSEFEISEYGLVVDGQRVTWDENVASDISIDVGEQGIKLLLDALESSDKLSAAYVPLYDKIKAVANGVA